MSGYDIDEESWERINNLAAKLYAKAKPRSTTKLDTIESILALACAFAHSCERQNFTVEESWEIVKEIYINKDEKNNVIPLLRGVMVPLPPGKSS